MSEENCFAGRSRNHYGKKLSVHSDQRWKWPLSNSPCGRSSDQTFQGNKQEKTKDGNPDEGDG